MSINVQELEQVRARYQRRERYRRIGVVVLLILTFVGLTWLCSHTPTVDHNPCELIDTGEL